MHILAYVGMLAIGLLAAAIVYCALVPPNFGPPRVEHRQGVFTHRDLLKTCFDPHTLIGNSDYVQATIIAADVLLTNGDTHGRKIPATLVLDALAGWTAQMGNPQAVLRCMPEYAPNLAGAYPTGYRVVSDALVRESMARWRLAHAFKAKA